MSTPEQPAYKRSVFDPTSPVNPDCPLCWANGRLEGGTVLAEGDVFFVYVFTHDDGTLEDGYVAPKQHHPDPAALPENWGKEFWKFFALLRDTFGIQEHNGYWNEGFAAGQRVFDHWHVRIDAAPKPGTPAYGMGLATLRRRYSSLYWAYT